MEEAVKSLLTEYGGMVTVLVIGNIVQLYIIYRLWTELVRVIDKFVSALVNNTKVLTEIKEHLTNVSNGQ